uniref:Glutaredoxin 5 n=1 Tax=Buteo japonicus TaxID=224669 RepID=A0A8B9Z4I0_9AVES
SPGSGDRETKTFDNAEQPGFGKSLTSGKEKLQNAVERFQQAGIKNYSNWPTIPQVYLNGEFVGGCDILLQMHQNGDLVEELKKLGIRSALLDAEKDQDKK